MILATNTSMESRLMHNIRDDREMWVFIHSGRNKRTAQGKEASPQT